MQPRQVAHHQACGMDAFRFDVLDIDAGVADVRVGQGDDLPGIRRVGEDFLIAGECGVEHHFTARDAIGADRLAAKNRAVSENQDGGLGTRQGKLRMAGDKIQASRSREPA